MKTAKESGRLGGILPESAHKLIPQRKLLHGLSITPRVYLSCSKSLIPFALNQLVLFEYDILRVGKMMKVTDWDNLLILLLYFTRSD